MTGRNMKLTIESMTYGADGLAHADNGKAVFVQGAVAGDTVEAEVVQDGTLLFEWLFFLLRTLAPV